MSSGSGRASAAGKADAKHGDPRDELVDHLPALRAFALSLTREGEFGRDDTGSDEASYPLLPTGSRFAAGNGVVCAVPTADTLACRAAKPDSWPAETPDPPDRHYGEHGFVIAPTGSWTY